MRITSAPPTKLTFDPSRKQLAMSALGEEFHRFLGEVEAALCDNSTSLSIIPYISTSLSIIPCIDRVVLSAEWLLRDVLLIEYLLPVTYGNELVESIVQVVADVQREADRRKLARRRGRPSIEIPEDHLAMLIEYRFSLADISRMMNVSARTIRRRVLQYGLESSAAYSVLTDSQLDEITTRFVHTHPHSGRISFLGYLRSVGLRVQESRVRESLRRVDPRGIEQRFRQTLHRRKYSVCMPNSLWHIDGHHKLVCWRIVVHGGIDGYSRLVVFLKASTNNKAQTMLTSFLTAVDNFGLPSRVRCNKGGENVLVSQYMLKHPSRGPGRGSCITGRSVHNQRIERLWRDLFTGCIVVFYMLFASLEDQGLLDSDNPTDLFCLHNVFLPRINIALGSFLASYNHHPMRTAGNKSPYQLWISGIGEQSGDEEAVQGVEEIVDVVRLFPHFLYINVKTFL